MKKKMFFIPLLALLMNNVFCQEYIIIEENVEATDNFCFERKIIISNDSISRKDTVVISNCRYYDAEKYVIHDKEFSILENFIKNKVKDAIDKFKVPYLLVSIYKDGKIQLSFSIYGKVKMDDFYLELKTEMNKLNMLFR